MGIALFSASSLFMSFQHLMRWLVPEARRGRASPASPSRGRTTACTGARLIHLSNHGVTHLRAVTPNPTARPRPLRVVRVVDTRHAPTCAGRMVISGRMADVCAELDRLAALEASPTPGLALG